MKSCLTGQDQITCAQMIPVQDRQARVESHNG
jgi:hypothetical protein